MYPHIPIHLIAPFMANNDLIAFQKCLILNKEFHSYAKEHTFTHLNALFTAKHPVFWSRIKKHVGIMDDLKSFDLKVLLSVLDAFEIIKNRKKGERYQHLLKPLMNRTIFSEHAFEKGQTKQDILRTLTILVMLVEYSALFRSGTIDPKKWTFYAMLDYGFYGIAHLQENDNVFCDTKFQRSIFDKSDTTLPSDFKEMPSEPRYKLQRLLGDIMAFRLRNPGE